VKERESLLPDRDAEVTQALRDVGLPEDAPLSRLIQHHRANAAFATGFDNHTWKTWARRHADATDGGDGSVSEHGEGCLVCKAIAGEL
jgi:hypothetical protein